MAATVQIHRYTGAGPANVHINTNTAVTQNDLPQIIATAATAANPIPIPAAGTNYSYWATTGLEVTVAPTTGINNLRWYTDGTDGFGTGVACRVHTTPASIPRGSYDQATAAVVLTTHTAITVAATPFSFTSGSPKTVTGSIGATTGALGEFVVYNFEVINTASPGPTAQETFTWAFDET